MRYGFTRGIARVQIVIGVLIIVAGAVLTLVWLYASFNVYPQLPVFRRGFSPRQELVARVLVGVALFVAGFFIGTSCIVSGQLILVFLDIRERLLRIDRRLRDWKTPTEPESPMMERLRPRSRP